MGFLDKAKAAAEQATAKAKEGVSDVQTKRELATAYTELGQKAYELADSGAISHAELDPIVERIRRLKAQDENGAATASAPAASSGSTSPPPSDAPPAMPT
jgi:hypothetical protein